MSQLPLIFANITNPLCFAPSGPVLSVTASA
jgi:hypothetical protein